jgi:aspartate/methionine/tyrosine aminotransferase
MAAVLAARMQAEQRAKAGLPVFDAGMGESPFSPPQKLKELLQREIAAQTRYGSCAGSPTFQKWADPNLVLTGNGLKPLICILQSAIEQLGGRSYLAVPYWPGYMSYAKTHDIYPHSITPFCGYKLTPHDIYSRLSGLSDGYEKPHVLFVSNPCNPTGEIYTDHELSSLCTACARHNIILFEDRIYEHLVPKSIDMVSCDSTEPLHLGSDLGESRGINARVITGHSLSKVIGAGGWRFGWMLFDPSLDALYAECVRLAGITYSAPSPAFETIAMNLEQYSLRFSEQAKELDRGNYLLRQTLKGTGIAMTPTQGGWYTLLDFDKVPAIKAAFKTSGDLCCKLTEDVGIISLPGTAFGLEPGKLILRLSLIVGDFSKWDHHVIDSKAVADEKQAAWENLAARGEPRNGADESGPTYYDADVTLLNRELVDWRRLQELGNLIAAWIAASSAF